jgi:hypothetical protein
MGVVGHARPEKTKLLTSQLLTEPPGRGSPKDVTDAVLVRNPSVGQWRRAVYTFWVTRSETRVVGLTSRHLHFYTGGNGFLPY